MSVLKDLVYEASLGEFGKLDLYLPDTDGPCPLLVYFHGGGIVDGSRGDGKDPTFLRLNANGIAVASVEYRMYRFDKNAPENAPRLLEDSPRFPDFIEDCAAAVAWLKKNAAQYHAVDGWYIGGSSAGGYLTMMLFFDSRYLGKHGLDPRDFDGYLFDAGQPTVHFNELAARGMDNRLVRVDEAAPLYWIDASMAEGGMPRIWIIYADNDMVNRAEQNLLLYRTMVHFGYRADRITVREMKGYGHCGYCGKPEVFSSLIEDFICQEG